MRFSPKLKKAMQQIDAILQVNDIAGVVILHTPGHSEYLTRINPTYSCASIVDGGIKFKTDPSDPVPKKKQMAADTLEMVDALAMQSGQTSLNLLEACELLQKATGMRPGGSSHTSQQELDN